MLNIITIPAFDDNYIWLAHHQGNNNCIVVDPGDAVPVFAALEKHQLELEAILITHHHPDHVGGVEQLVSATKACVYGPAKENIPSLDKPLSEPDSIHLAKSELIFDVLDVSGHTKGHIAYVTNNTVFTGDSLFAGGCGRIFEGTPEQMHKALTKLANLPDETRVYCAHEYTESNLNFALAVETDNKEIIQRLEQVQKDRANKIATVPTTIALEKATNPFLRSHLKSLQDAAKSYSGVQPNSEIETFTTIRKWKDNY